MGLLAAEIQTKEAGDIRVPSPVGTKAALCVGWKAQKADNTTVFLPIGATYHYEAGENTKFVPVYFHFITTTSATPILADTEHGICFTTDVNKADWEVISSISPGIQRGTLVLPTIEAQKIDAITHEALASLPTEVQVSDILTDTWSAEGETTLTFSAPFTDIPEENHTTNYTALGYIKITYTDGSERYAYATYGKEGMPAISFYSFPEAVRKYLQLITNASGVLDLTAKNGGLCFVTSIPKEQWTALVNTSHAVSLGTLIFPTVGLTEIGGKLTHAAIEKAGATAFDIPSTTWLGGTSGTILSFGATHTEIAVYDRALSYTAVGYIKITHADESITYIYAGFGNNTPPSANVMSLAINALMDLSDTEDAYYQYPTPGGFSPYTEAERAKLDEISKFPILLIADSSVKGNRRLDENYLSIYNERIITDNDPTCAEEWHTIYQMLGDTIYSDGGALIITAKNGMAFTENNISTIQINYGSRVGTISTYLFMDGALIIPYKVYSRPY